MGDAILTWLKEPNVKCKATVLAKESDNNQRLRQNTTTAVDVHAGRGQDLLVEGGTRGGAVRLAERRHGAVDAVQSDNNLRLRQNNTTAVVVHAERGHDQIDEGETRDGAVGLVDGQHGAVDAVHSLL